MRKFLLFVAVACLSALAAWSQLSAKYSASTRMFLAQRAGLVADTASAARLAMAGKGAHRSPSLRVSGSKPQLEVAQSRIDNGVEVIDAFIGLNGTSVAQLEALGVRVQRVFRGFVTAAIPVDKIESVAALSSVKRIQVAQVMRLMTDSARSQTNVDKVIAGVSHNLPRNYDATGVIVGVVDTGIDPKHEAYNDAQGNTRIKRMYQVKAVTSSSSTTSSSTSYKQCFYKDSTQFATLDPDCDDESHGTHTSTTAAGKKIHTAYGDFLGIAPNCDIYLCGLAALYNTYIANGVDYITAYADSVGKPCVISLSLGGVAGPHDGSDYLSQVYTQATANPGHILVLAAANQAGNDMYVYKTGATAASPLVTRYQQKIFSDIDRGGFYYYSGAASAWARTAGVPLAAKVMVVNANTGAEVWTSDEITLASMNSNGYYLVSGLSSYYTAYSSVSSSSYLYVTIEQDANSGKYNVTFVPFNLRSRSYSSSSGTVTSNYEIAFMVYPASAGAAATIDMWESGYYGNFEAGGAGRYTAVQGSDKCSASSECYASGVITVGAYVSRKSFVGANATSGYTVTSSNSLGDIADFSSYVEEGYGPDHDYAIPWITAPGQTVVAGVNHMDTQNYGTTVSGSEYQYITQSNSTSYFGTMSGTSMATPCVAGIVALWLQAHPKWTVADVRKCMRATAIHDDFTAGTHSTRFGNGKINALGAFSTSTLAAIVAGSTTGDKVAVTDGDLTCVYVYAPAGSNSVLYCKDANGYAEGAKSVAASGEIDYVKNAGLQPASLDWDQSNWVALVLPRELTTADPPYAGKKLTGVTGTYTASLNPEITVDALPGVGDDNAYTPNNYVAANFGGTQDATEPYDAAGNKHRYFFVTPKPGEIARVNWARYDGAQFSVPTTYAKGDVKSNAAGLAGSAVANLTMIDAADGFEANHVYSFLALITRTATSGSSAPARRAQAASGFTVFPLESVTEVGTDDGSVVTGVSQVATGAGVQCVTYYNTLGMSSTVPFEGINVAVITHADGTRTVVKMVR